MVGTASSRGLSSTTLVAGVVVFAVAAGILFVPQFFGNSSKFSQQVANRAPAPSSAPQTAIQAQQVSLKASSNGYDKLLINVKAGVPVHLSFTADASAGCGTTLIIDGQPVNINSNNGQEVFADFTPAAGTYAYHCPEGVLTPGKLVAN